MKKMVMKLFVVIVTLNFILGSIAVNAANETNVNTNQNTNMVNETKDTNTVKEITEQQKALVNIANAYYSKGEAIIFDQKKRQLDVRPEDAKKNSPIYLDSSSLVYNIYRQAFGIELQQESDKSQNLTTTSKLLKEAEKECKTENKNIILKNKTSDKYIVCYSDKSGFSNINLKASLKNLKEVLEPGDLIVWRETNREKEYGRVVMYMENGEVIRCTGKNGQKGMKKVKITELITKGKSMYLGKSNVKKFAVIRPLNAKYMENAKLTEYAEIKNEIPNVNIQLNSSIGNSKTVKRDGNIKYTLLISNNGTKKVKDLIINEEISNYLDIDKDTITNRTFKTRNGQEIAKNIVKDIKISDKNAIVGKIPEIDIGATVEIKCTAKVNANEKNIGKKIETQAKVGKTINGVDKFERTNKIVNVVGKTLKEKVDEKKDNNTDEKKDNKADEKKDNNTDNKEKLEKAIEKYTNKKYNGKTRELVNKVYKEALNIDCGFEKTTIKKMLNNVIPVKNKTIKLATNNTKARKMLVENMYGFNKKQYKGTIDNQKELNINNLESGDLIIYTYKYKQGKNVKNKYVMYMYIPNDKLIAVSGGKVVVRNNVKDKLKRIQEKDRFMVLRPTQIK